MRFACAIVLGGALLLPGGVTFAKKNKDKGALKEKVSPSADLKIQEQNVEKLRQDAAADRKVGNRAGAWAADLDRKHAEKLIKKDRQLLDSHRTKTTHEK